MTKNAKENILHAFLYISIIVIIWICAKYFADSISDYEVIQPEPGVKCVVVSRAFNTSVSCWKV